MPRLIDADELYIDARCGKNEEPYISLYQINDAPTVDAEPVRHGQWLTSPTGWLYCSECGGEPPCEINVRTDYCPNCGAKMDEVKDGSK